MGSKYPFVKSHSFFSKYFLLIFLHSQFIFFLKNAYSSSLSSKNTNTTIYISWQIFPIQAQLVKVWECLDLQLQRLRRSDDRLVYFRDKNRRDKESVFLFPRIIRSFPRTFVWNLAGSDQPIPLKEGNDLCPTFQSRYFIVRGGAARRGLW